MREYDETLVAGSIDGLIDMVVHLALAARDPEQGIRMAAEAIPLQVPELLPADATGDECYRIARQWVVGIWKQLPLPWNDYRPLPLPDPGRNDPCPCGSGRKYKHCCARLPSLGDMPDLTLLLWTRVLQCQGKDERRRLLRAGRVPVDVVGSLAQEELGAGAAKRAMEWLEPVFAGDIDHLGPQGGVLLDMLCDAYDHHYRTDRKKLALLERATHARSKEVRAAAWQRLAAIRMDGGDSAGAWQAFQEAQRADPDDPNHALLEVTLLCARNEWDRAQQRAGFWLARLRRLRDPELEPLRELLTKVSQDPRRALTDVEVDADGTGGLASLRRWVDRIEERPVLPYRVVPMHGDAAPDDPYRDGMVLETPKKLAAIERQWHAVFPLDKPFSVQTLPFHGDPWAKPESWLAFLERHPETGDSLDILDDVSTALTMHEASGAVWVRQDLHRRILHRAETILQASVGTGAAPHVPWVVAENRPALRLLSHAVSLALDTGAAAEVQRRLEWMLALNPNDNHGWRGYLANTYLRGGEAGQALALCERYPDDTQPEILYGRALALFLLGRRDEADAALREATEKLPKVLQALRRARMRQPAFGPHGITFGGDDQAWLYRDEMREVWLQNGDVRRWLGIK